MAETAVRKPAAAKTRKPATEKQKPIGFVNWSIVDKNGKRLLSSSKGFALFDNEYLSNSDKALLAEAKKDKEAGGSGTVVFAAELRVSVARDESEELDLSSARVQK